VPTLELDVPTVGLWTLVLNIPVGDQWFKLYREGEGEVPRTNLGQGIDFPTVILRCLYESFKLNRASYTSPSNSSHSFSINILSFDSDNL
jgi:hypothetical protein